MPRHPIDLGTHNLGQNISDSVKDLFGERAKWVRTWICSRALPFIALLAFAASFVQITIIGILPGLTLSIGIALLIMVTIRAIRPIRGKFWPDALGHYQASMTFFGVLLLLGSIVGDQTQSYWLWIWLGFWGMAAAYVAKWLVPGELTIAAITLTCLSLTLEPPLPAWAFVPLTFAPVIGLLGWKYSRITPALSLAVLILIVWIGSNPDEVYRWIILLVAVAMLAAGIYAIGKLATPDASAFVQSIGLGLISGLLFFIFANLLKSDANSSGTWWSMYAIFLLICGVLRYRSGSLLTPLLVLWCTHWGVITGVASWHDLDIKIHDFLVFSIFVALGAGVLRWSASQLDSHRLYNWSRVYLAAATLILAQVTLPKEKSPLFLLLFATSLFATAVWLSQEKTFRKGAPWWRGLMNPRHVVGLRRTIAKGGNLVASIPFVGATAAASIQAVKVVSRLKSNGGGIHAGDMLLIIVALSLATILTNWLALYLPPDIHTGLFTLSPVELTNATGYRLQKLNRDLVLSSAQLLISGGLFGLISFMARDAFHQMLSMAAFAVAPIAAATSGGINPLFWLICLVSAVGILGINEIVSKGKHGQHPKTVQPRVSAE